MQPLAHSPSIFPIIPLNPFKIEADLRAAVASYVDDPEGFVLFAFPWGEGPLEEFDGPDQWQRETLRRVGDALRAGGDAGAIIREAIASGHGIGKSAFVAWIILWAMCTFEDTRGVVTANTENQLKTKTWSELAKWFQTMNCRHWFELTATAIFAKDPVHQKTWRVDMSPWSERNTEAFQGLHNKRKRVLLIFDEASAIPPAIWDAAEGALTDENTQIIWCVFGNPTRNTGKFRECFGKYKHRWEHHQIDSRTARMTNKTQIGQWIEDYGEDSDFVRVRVKGQFPRSGSSQLISAETVEKAKKQQYEPFSYSFAPILIGVDVARFGDDQTIIYVRQGLHTHEVRKFRGLDTMETASRVAESIRKYRTGSIGISVFIDGVGIGAGVVDRLNQLGYGSIIINVEVGRAALDSRMYFNLRAECWNKMRLWLEAGGSIPDDDQGLYDSLTGPEYGYDNKERLQLEKKEDIKARGLASPDEGDALAITFAYPVSVQDFEDSEEEERDDYRPRSRMCGY